MKVHLNRSVYAEALDRVRFIYDEFEEVTVCTSGGKDSSVCFHLALTVAREKGRLPLKIMWIDQEAEWAATVDMVRSQMYHPEVEPYWYQIPFKLFNATSVVEHWLYCWDPKAEDKWIFPKDPCSIKENIYGTDRFKKLFGNIMAVEYPDKKACQISGVRCEESPGRKTGLTTSICYKWITWGTQGKLPQHKVFYPIYDWSVSDVWKCIHDNDLPYCRIYDLQYQYGLSVNQMRVSNIHHETAVRSLFYLQEMEPETYVRVVRRLPGIDMAGKMGFADYFVKELPYMFSSWREYRDYLLDKLITDPKWRQKFTHKFAMMDKRYGEIAYIDDLHATQVQSLLVNDWEFVKLDNWETQPVVWMYRKWQAGKKIEMAGIQPYLLAQIPEYGREQIKRANQGAVASH